MAVRYWVFWLGNGECRSFRVKVVLPFNPHLAEFEHVVVFDFVHTVAYIVCDLGLQFTDETLENAHLGARKKSGVLQDVDMARDRVKVIVDAGQRLISLDLSSKIGSSHLMHLVALNG